MAQSTQTVRALLMGVGHVGRRVLELLIVKETRLREQMGLDVRLVGVADGGGAALCADGLDLQRVIDLKTAGHSVAAYPRWGQPGVSALEMVRTANADVLLEASPASLSDGQPGLSCVEAALERGMHVVTANKAPLVLAFPRLMALAKAHGVRLQYDATVAGGLPAINLGQRDLALAQVERLEGILNLTTNYILTCMAQDGLSYAQALAQAQEAGHAEADPTLDVEGWDAANKLVILAHSVLGYPASRDQVQVTGIGAVTPEMLRQAAAQGKVIKPLAVAQREGDGYRLMVGPVALPADHPMAQLKGKQMGLVYHTDISGSIAAAIVEETPQPTASAMLRDLVDICTSARPEQAERLRRGDGC